MSYTTSIHRHQTPPRSHRQWQLQHVTYQSLPSGVAPTTAKRDVIHKTGSAKRSATLPEEDRATATGELQTTFREDRSNSSRDMLADRQTDRHTHRQTDKTDRRVDQNTPHPYFMD